MPSHSVEHARGNMKAVAGLLALLACSCWLATAQAAAAATPQQAEAAVAAAAAASSSSDPNGQGHLLWLIGKWLSNNDEAVLSAWGWSPTGDPCLGTWQGVTCNKRGFVTAIHLAHKGLRGSLPTALELWAGMKALRDIDVSGNILSGPVPAAISAAGPQLENIDLSGNIELCGGRLAGLPGLVADNTNIDMDCLSLTDGLDRPAAAAQAAAAAAQLPALPALPAYTPLAAHGASPAAAQPAAASGFVPAASPKQLFDEQAGQPSVARIGRAEAAPICNCAQNGFGSQECSAAISSACGRTMGVHEHPLCAQAADVGQDVNAAKELATLLAAECFIGQDLETRICGCVQSLMGSECAKARVGLCLKQDPLCLPFQNIINTNSSTSARAVSVVAAVLDKECPIAEPTVQGVKATIEFPDLTMDSYISEDYTLNVGNALSSVAAVPSTAVSGLDVRPLASTYASHRASPARSFLMRRGNDLQAAAAPVAAAGPVVIHVTVKPGIRIINPPSSNATSNSSNATSSASNATVSTGTSTSGGVKHRRQLLQSAAAGVAAAAAPPGGAGVQATYFIETEDPAAVSHTISAAASEGLLSTRLEQYGVAAPVGGLIIELFMLAPGQKLPGSGHSNPGSSAPGGASSSGTTSAGYALALVAIITGCVLLCSALGAAGFWCWRRKQAAKSARLWSLLGGGRRVKPLTSVASVIKTAGGVKMLPEPSGPGVVATIQVPAAAAMSGTAGGTFQPNADRDGLLPRSFDYPAPAPEFAYPPKFSQPDEAAPASFSSAVAAAMAAPAAAMVAAAAGAGSAARSVAAAVAAAASGSSSAAADRRSGPKAAAGAGAASAAGASRASGRAAAASGPVKQQRLATGVSGAPVSLAKNARPSRTSSSTPRSGPVSPCSSNPSSASTPKVSLSASASGSYESPSASHGSRAASGQRSSVPGAAAAAGGQRGEGAAAGGKPLGRLMSHREALQDAAGKKEPAAHGSVAFGSTIGQATRTASAPSSRWWA